MSLPFNHGAHPELVTRSPKRPKRRHLTTASDRDYNSNYTRSTVNSVKTPSIIGLENLRMHPSEEYTVDVVQPRSISYQPLSTKAPTQAFLPNVTQQWEGRQRTTVYVTVVFLKIGEIQTIKEYFEADVYIQAKWREPVLDKTRTKVSDFSQFWNPELVLQNVFEDPKEKIWHEVRYTPRGEAFIHEMRRVKAKFFETMELNHFPFDIQTMSVVLTSELTKDNLQIEEDKDELGCIYVDCFSDSQAITVHHSLTNITGGVFYCNRDGIYKFQIYATSAVSAGLFLEVFVNDYLIESLYGHTTGGHATAGNVAIVQLKTGDRVKVMTRGSFSVTLYNDNTNTFTGVQQGSQIIYYREEDVVAFSVTANHNQNVAGGSPLQYNTKLVNDNGSFDLDGGVYHVPSSGYYILHFFSIARQNEELWQDLRINGNYVCSIYAFTDFDWADGGNSVIVHLHKGDNVSVVAKPGHDNYLYGSFDHIFTTFSGVELISDSNLHIPDSEPIVFFSVGLVKERIFSTTSIVLFDVVFVDIKNSYNRTTGRFVAPVTGLYEFNYHAVAKVGETLYLRLMHNGEVIRITSSNTNHRPTGGNAAVLEVTGGDSVYIETHFRQTLLADYDEIYCTFSGHLLSATGPGLG